MSSSSVFVLLVLCSVMLMVHAENLLVVLLDGFRWDYIENHDLENFKRLMALGTHAHHMKPDFPTISIPNHYTIMTGLHTEHHGMTGNFMYDYERKSKFLLSTTDARFESQWWEGGEPLWITATRQDKKSFMYRWRGCEVEIHGYKPTKCIPFTDNVQVDQFDAAVSESFALFRNGSADVTGVYNDAVDVAGHWYGPDSRQVADSLRAIDNSVGKLVDQWQSLNDDGFKVNVMIVSDHGMGRVSTAKLINVTHLLTPDLYETIMESGPVMSVYTPRGNSEAVKQVYDRLHNFHPNMTCYHKKDLPDRWFYKEGKFVSPVTCVADLGWFILHPLQTELWKRETDGKLLEGEHGYDNRQSDMWGIFLGLGPAFMPQSSLPSIDAVDLYGVMCRLAGLQPSHNDGNPERANPLLLTDWKISAVASVKTDYYGLCIQLVLSWVTLKVVVY